MKNTYYDALEQAKSNAAYFKRPYIVFCDSMNKWQSQSLDRLTHVAYALVMPDGAYERSSVQVEAGVLMLKFPEQYRQLD